MGQDTLFIRTLVSTDLDVGLILSEQAGWNQTPADWQRFLRLAPAGCFVAMLGNRPCGTVTTCCFETVAWIGMLLVDADFRQLGIGTRLFETALGSLEQAGAPSIRLDATAQGLPLYERYGFLAQFELSRLQCTTPAPRWMRDSVLDVPWPNELQVSAAAPHEMPGICELDRLVTQSSRVALLEQLWQQPESQVMTARRNGQLVGFGFRRPGRLAHFLGPVVVADSAVFRPLLYDLMRGSSPPAGWIIDVPSSNAALIQWPESIEFATVRTLVRMVRGTMVCESDPLLFVSSGPEKG